MTREASSFDPDSFDISRASEDKVPLNKDKSDDLITMHEFVAGADPPEEDLLDDYFDGMVALVCESPSIYTLVWMSRHSRPDYVIAYLFSLAIQVCLPVLMWHRRQGVFSDLSWSLPGSSNEAEIKTAAMLFSLYLASTCTGAMKRALGMGYLSGTMPERPLPKMLGALAVLYCIVMTCLNTWCLFVESPVLGDILLNCCALNFLPDADTTLANLLEMLHLGAFQNTKHRLNVFQEGFPKSKERKEGLAFWKADFISQAMARPFFSIFRALELVTRLFTVCLPIVLFFTVQVHHDHHSD